PAAHEGLFRQQLQRRILLRQQQASAAETDADQDRVRFEARTLEIQAYVVAEPRLNHIQRWRDLALGERGGRAEVGVRKLLFGTVLRWRDGLGLARREHLQDLGLGMLERDRAGDKDQWSAGLP